MTSVYAALAAVMADVGHVAKRDINRQQKFTFRGIDAVLSAVGPALRTHKVIVVPNVIEYHYGEIQVGEKRTPMGHARVIVAYTFYGPDGDSVQSSAPGEAFDSGDKATAKAMSVAYRTALIQALALPTDEPDPDSQSYERAHQEQQRPRDWEHENSIRTPSLAHQPPVDHGPPPLAEAKARAWNVGRRLWPDAKPDELKRETEGALMDMGSSIASADTATWTKLAEQWEAQV